MISHLDTILSYRAAGLSIIPIRKDGSKAPIGSWTPNQERPASEETLRGLIAHGHEGWALVCGAVSGNVEVIDFDDPEKFAQWLEQIDNGLYERLTVELTPRGGRHVFYRCKEIGGNAKLAQRMNEENGKPDTLIETRGEGGYTVIDPTTGAYHKTGRPYRIIQGALTAIPEVTPEERTAMLSFARVLNEYFPVTSTWTPSDTPHDSGNGDHRPGDDYADEVDWREILEPHGWRALYQRGDCIVWQRPGKDGPGGSAQTGGRSPRTGFSGLYVYSTNAAPFESERGYGKFSAYATLNWGGDFNAAAAELRRQGYGRQVIVSERPRPKAPAPLVAEPEDDTPEVPDTLDGLRNVDVPDLPQSAYIDPREGEGASPWLEAYVNFSRQWSPRSFEDFHFSCGLWLLSTLAARRVVSHLGGARYTNLYISLVARSSLWAKSTAAKIVQQTVAEAGLQFLMAPDDSTPQRFISDLVRKVPADWDSRTSDEQRMAQMRLSFPAARGWFFEEFGMKLDQMLSPGGFMADFRGILRQFDDCPESYQYASIGRGVDSVQHPYVALLGNMTPADLKRAAKKSDGLWQDGFWARWAFVTPPAYTNSSRARFPQGERAIPSEILAPLARWHARLGTPHVDVEERHDAEGKAAGYEAHAEPTVRTHVTIDQDAQEAFYCYGDGLLDIVEASEQRDMDGNYARFAEKALRVAMLIASLENGDRITLRVWALAQGIAERWRRSLHELYAQATEPDEGEAVQKEERALGIVTKQGEMTANEVRRNMRGVTNAEVAMILDGLVNAGALVRTAQTRRGTARYAVAS
jgi:hypothetical protein